MDVRPFRGYRPRADLAARIPSPPYDVLDSDEARLLAEGDPYTFLHVVKSEIDLPRGTDLHDDAVYARARENFAGMIRRGWLVRDPRPAYYVWRLERDGHAQTGVVGVAALDDYVEGRIKRHEHTRPDKEHDRVRHAEALQAHPGSIFLAHRGHPALETFTAEVAGRVPESDFVAPDRVRHRLWRVDDPAETARVAAAFAEIPATYIADGHHRAAAYTRVGLAARDRGEAAALRASDFLLAVHFPAAELRILDYNRLVRDLGGLEPRRFVERLRDAGFVSRPAPPGGRPDRPGTFGMFFWNAWWLLEAEPGTIPEGDPVRRLDVAVLADRILRPILGVGDERTDPRIAFVGGSRGTEELERRVRSGEHRVAFSLFPTRMADVMAVADAGGVMPPKSTWFEPKLLSGMVVHRLDAEAL